jgi:hypothetical protein
MYNKFRFKNKQIIIGLILISLFILIFVNKKNNIELFKTHSGIRRASTPTEPNSDSVVICVGDSILDNKIYVPNNKSVVDYIRLNSYSNTYVINVSKDGAKITDIYNQFRHVPSVNSSNLIIILSVGGNDLLEYEPIEKAYRNYIELLKYIKDAYQSKLYILNLYYPMDKSMKKYYETIRKWNKLLTEIPQRENIKLNIIDISKIITEPTDLVNKIEPSVTGGLKIANQIIEIANI